MAQPCGGAWLRPRGARSQPPGMRLAARGPCQARSYAALVGLWEGPGPGRGPRLPGGGAEGCSRALPSLRAPSRRPGVPEQPPPLMGEVEPGPAGPLEPPEPPEAPASRRAAGIRVLKVRRAGKGARAGRGRLCPAQWRRQPAAPAPRQSVRFAAPLSRSPAGGAATRRGLHAWPPRRPRPPPSVPLPIPGRAPPAGQAHAFWPASARPPPPTRLLRDPGPASAFPRGPGSGARSPLAESGAGSTQGFPPRTPEDITPAGGWRR